MSFKDIFNIDAEVKESAHARVNLIGEHTDYTGGYVMPTLLSFKNTIEISQNNSNEFTNLITDDFFLLFITIDNNPVAPE